MNTLDRKKREIETLRRAISSYEERHNHNLEALVELAKTTEIEGRRGYILDRVVRTHNTLYTNMVTLRGW